ncbi:MAG: hypothetical protein CMJ20_12815 [Phycisphaeraceae bacterium]|nr:hypothetical protein [Phycisphaeraceae bacterium]
MSPGKLLSNRYLLGISLADINMDDLHEICCKLKMPKSLLAQLQKNIPEANLVFLGFEDDEEGTSYRVYLEYWDKICAEIKQAPHKIHPRLMFLGYKWNIQHPDKQAITEYTCYPMLNTSKILERITNIYQSANNNCAVEQVLKIIRRAARQCADRMFIYLEVGEGNNLRSSFDLNIYKSGLQLQDIDDVLIDLQVRYKIREADLSRIQKLAGSRLLGHISGGTSRNGEDFLTLYYEN